MEHQISTSALRRRKQPETLRLRAVMPVLTVNDLETSVAWYRDVLGFVVADVAERDDEPVAAQLLAGKVRVMLVQDEDPGRWERPKGDGFRIFCATRQDVDALAEIVRERGGLIDQEPRDQWGGRDFAVMDPDGFRISITSGAQSRGPAR